MKLYVDKNKRYANGLEYQSVNGWHKDFLKCTKNLGKYKIYSVHFNCALPYSIYYVANTKTGEVLTSDEYHYNFKEVFNELVNQLKEEVA